MNNGLMSEFTCKIQVDKFIESSNKNDNAFWNTFIKVMLYLPPDCCAKYARKMLRLDAIKTVKHGVILYNGDNETRNFVARSAPASPELICALRLAIELSIGNDLLFPANNSGSNRAMTSSKEITRQSIYRNLKKHNSIVRSATLDSGMNHEFEIGISTLLKYDGTKSAAAKILKTIVAIHGGNISSELMAAINSELKSIG
tara:strand:+ start:253 stop:855 length:603 start_codon:yes stop_codon:yes gene_type:complete